MCGILGYIGYEQAAPFLVEGLTKLEYRGYDSAGIAVFDGQQINVEKSIGNLERLKSKLVGNIPAGVVGIGHTRWATHGKPSDVNAHPHTDCTGRFVVVHNGIIENYLSLKEQLLERGHVFKSETDSEVIAHLIEEYYAGDFVAAVQKVLAKVQSSSTLVFMSKDEPDKLICWKRDNPLVIGLGEGENFIASDIPAIISRTRKIYVLNDGEMAVITKETVAVFDRDGLPAAKQVLEVHWDAKAAEKDGYDHFMLKEIVEQPKAILATMTGRLTKESAVMFDELKWTKEQATAIKRIMIVACGTAYHAGLVGKTYLEKLANIPVEVDIASEFRYRQPILEKGTLVIVISQSGETIDTLSALKEAKRLGARTLAVTNVVSSSIAREAAQVVYTYAGPEIAVASTKAYTTQLVCMLMLSIYLADLRQAITTAQKQELIGGLQNLPEKIVQLLESSADVKAIAERYAFNKDMFFIGRSLDYAVALEGSLKLKEISYIHAEAYAAGELKHGTLALIIEDIPVVALATQKDVFEKTISNIQEVKARGAVVIAVALDSDTNIAKLVDHCLFLPAVNQFLVPVLAAICLQLFSYYAAVALNREVDRPRNLAKSVTVE